MDFHIANSDLMLEMASSWVLQVIVGMSWRSQVKMEIVWVMR